MDELDKLLSRFLRERKVSARTTALTDEEIRLFIENRLDGPRLENVLERLAASSEDRELVAAVRKRLEEAGEAQNERVQESLIGGLGGSRAAGSGTSSCPHCGGAITPFKKSPARQRLLIGLWASLCLAGLAASFIFPAYFMQGLAVSLLAGFKWITDHRALKTQILVYRALEEPFDAPKRRDLQRDDARL